MRNIKFSGIKFRKDDESGIAKINIIDVTTSTEVIVDALVDLYTADQDYTIGKYESFVYWATLDPADHDYIVIVEHSGTHNPSAGGSYHIQVDAYLITEELIDGKAEVVVTAEHSDHIGTTFEYTMSPDVNTSSYKQATFNGDGILDSFVLSSNNRASNPYKFSIDGGTTWLYPNSYQLTWGSILTSTGYINELMDSDGYFGVTFDTPPIVGVNNVIIEYIPKVNKYTVTTTLKQPNDGSTFKDLRQNIRLLDHGVEAI